VAVVALAVGAVEVVARPVAVRVVLRACLKGLALRAWTTLVRLAVLTRGVGALRPGKLRRAALAVARVVTPLLLAVVRATLVAERSARATAAIRGRPAATAMAVGVRRLHWDRV
jgi:hypothetical protein